MRMKIKGTLSIRVLESNPNHHLWNNNGTWWIHYTEHPTPLTKCRRRASMETCNLEVARARRDAFLKARRFDANATPFAVAGEAQNDRDLRRRRLPGTAMRT